MKFLVAFVLLIMCIFFTNGTAPFFGNKYWILLGQTKPGKHHPGITIKEETNVTISDTRKIDGCLNSWIFTSGYMYLAQDGSLDFTGKSFTVGGYYYYTGPKLEVMILWHPGNVYMATFGAKPNANYYYKFSDLSLSDVDTWVFVGFSFDFNKNQLMGWVDDVVTRVNISSNRSYKELMKDDIVIGKYGKDSPPPPRVELAGLTVMAGTIEQTQIETFKADIRSTLAPTCTGSAGLSGFPPATMMLLALIVDELSRL